MRRLNFDLLGLPPTAREVDDFVNDPSPGAHGKLVDRLLASPHFGERQARHWLDLVRFGESSGFEHNTPWDEVWRYRDWVIHAFNTDLPYDEFVRLQLAGDVLRPGDPLAVTATGFLACGPYDQIGNELGTESMRKATRQTELGDLVGTVAQTFVGLSLDCARCHEHKFDPLSQRDYFQVAAVFGGTKAGSRPNAAGEHDAEVVAGLRRLEPRLTELERLRAAASERAGGILAEQFAPETDHPPLPPATPYHALVLEDEPLGYWRLGDAAESKVAKNLGTLGAQIDGTFSDSAQRGLPSLVGDADSTAMMIAAGSRVTVPAFEKFAGGTGFSVEFWAQVKNPGAGGFISLVGDGESGEDFCLMVYLGSGRIRAHLQTAAGIRAIDSTRLLNAGETVHVVSTWDARSGELALHFNGVPVETSTSIGTLPDQAAPAHTDNALFFGANGRGTPGGPVVLDEVAIYNKPLPLSRIALHARSGGKDGRGCRDWDELLEELDDTTADRAGEVFAIQRDLSAHLLHGRLAAPAATHAVTPYQPEVFHVLARGDFRNPGQVAAPGGVAVIGSGHDFGMRPDVPEAQRRIRFARWITDERNALLARVAVNRVWQSHFGVGLVATPNDFGTNGSPPSHPALLDWLAGQLIESGWSLKMIHRLIVTSATYRQQSLDRVDAGKTDADNLLLWRMTPRRLEAEAVRDTLLAVAGRLNPRLGGRGYRDFSKTLQGENYNYHPKEETTRFGRRSIYRMWVRSGTPSFLAAFDCPNTSVRTPRRAVTTTPLQALALLNSSLVDRQAEALAGLVARQAGEAVADQVALTYRRVLQRRPTAEESESAVHFIAAHGLRDFCIVLFNTNEFLHVD